ncbi:unnamed protein product [Phaeothamnion confervicola]
MALNAAPAGQPSSLKQWVDAATSAFPFWVLLAGVVALKTPAAFAGMTSGRITAALATTMVCMGATLHVDDFKAVARQPKPVVLGTLAQYTIMPFMGYLASRIWRLPAPLAVGVMLVGCCPGGTASNLVALIAGADVALSVAMTSVSTLLAAAATPLLTRLLVGGTVEVSAAALAASTARLVFAPVCAGLALNTYAAGVTEKASAFTPLLCVVLVALICGAVVSQNAAALLGGAGPGLVGAVATLHVGGFALGYGAPRVLGCSERAARTISIEVGMQNSALAVVLAQRAFPDPLSALPGAVSATTHSLIGSALATLWRLRDGHKGGGAAAPVEAGGAKGGGESAVA